MKSRTMVATLALSVVVGCGGSAGSDLITNAGDAGGGGDSSAGGDGQASDGASSDVGVASDGAVGGDGGSPQDAGPGGNTASLPCGTTTCAIPGQVCCVSQLQNAPPPFAYACATATTCPRNDTALACSSSANCPANEVCCVHPNTAGATSSCQAACGANDAQLCDPNALPTGCPQNATCSNANITDWGLPGTFGTCGGKGN